MKSEVFISYSRKDKEQVDMLCKALDFEGIEYWIDRNEIPLGSDFPLVVKNAIENSKVMVFISSENSKQSDWVTREIKYALNHKITVVPFKLDETEYNEKLAIFLDTYNHYEAYPPPIQVYLEEFTFKLKNILSSTNFEPFLKRITDENDPDLNVLLRIYKSCFEEDRNVAEEFIIQNLFLNEPDHNAYLFVLKQATKIIGIADVSYFTQEKRLFVSYIGVYHYKTPGDKVIYTHNIINGLIDYFAKSDIEIIDIIFETEQERIFKYFNRVLKNRFNLTAYKICFDYIQPKMLADNISGVTDEMPLMLIYVPVLNAKNQLVSMTKSDVIALVEFIYLKIYFNISDLSEQDHIVYLNHLLADYSNKLPDEIPLYKN